MITSTEPMIGKILYLPVRLTIWPEVMEVANSPTIRGTSRRPDTNAETPSTSWRYSGR